jgi:GTP-binding protein Era
MTSRCGYVAVVGAPNAGKSTLLNRLAGAKLAIATPKAQTTRRRTTGIVLRGETQILVVDTPGIFAPRRRLDRAMVAAAWTGARDADLALLLVDAKDGLTHEVRAIAEKLSGRAWLVLNKIDLVSLPALLPLTEALMALVAVERTLMISAANGDGVTDLLDALAEAMPEGPHLYPDEDITDLSDRALAAELVREQILLQVHEEVPHGTTVETESFREQRNGSIRVEATIYVARPGHKAILIGAKGARIRAIGAAARAQLASILEKEVHLFLNVKDRPGWDEETARLRALGLEDT